MSCGERAERVPGAPQAPWERSTLSLLDNINIIKVVTTSSLVKSRFCGFPFFLVFLADLYKFGVVVVVVVVFHFMKCQFHEMKFRFDLDIQTELRYLKVTKIVNLCLIMYLG